ncbi:alpha/beta fold hydrolase [Thalassobacillus devorans]|uniref:alpha/beta fold hydrolase n=1 Tax=Thalassobacillus devorans TaxID=279813 RepID=UPI000A1C8E15|nr:alpha/beta hydrolase [Thalassobacillus devorans]
MKPVLLETSNGLVEFRYEGQGPVILLLKGGHCSRDTDLSHQSLIHEGYKLLTVSRPGYDKTDIKAGKTPEDFADTLIEILDHLAIPSVQVIAVSAAGPTGLALAYYYPERVTSLILEAALVTPWEVRFKRKGKLLFGPAGTLVWKGLRGLLKVQPDFVMKMMLKELTTEDPEKLLKQLSSQDRKFVYEMLATSHSGKGFSADLEHQPIDLSKLTVPVLGMYAKKDGSVHYSNAILLQSLVPHSEIYEVPADSHLIWIGEHANAVWRKRLDFLQQHTKKPSAKQTVESR